MSWPNLTGSLRTTVEGFVIKLLIVDDSALMRKLLEGIFREEGDFDIQLARNGTEALELVRSFNPDVVTLDVEMPGMDGLHCLSQIMIESPRPVVMVSALTEEGAEATLEAIELGAVDFIAKPAGTVSLEIDRLRPVLVEKVRGAAHAKIRRTLRLNERIQTSISGRRRFAASVRARSGQVITGKRRIHRWATSDRHFDRRSGSARYRAAATSERLSLARAGCATYAREFHRAFRQAARPDLRAARCRGEPPDAVASWDDLYRQGDADVIVSRRSSGLYRNAGAGAGRLSLASQCGADGDERAGTL